MCSMPAPARAMAKMPIQPSGNRFDSGISAMVSVTVSKS